MTRLDIRDMLKAEINRRGLDLREAGQEFGIDRSCLINVMNGSQSLSVKVFMRAVKSCRVAMRRDLLQVWLAAFVQDKFGLEFVDLLKKAGWAFDVAVACPAVEAPAEDDFGWVLVKTEHFGATQAVRRRRMQLLEMVQAEMKKGAYKGLVISNALHAFKDTRDLYRHDLTALRGMGLVKSHSVKTNSRVDVFGQGRPRAQMCWVLTVAGETVLEEFKRRQRE